MYTSNNRYTYLNLLTWNIEGLKKYINDPTLKDYFYQFDVVGLEESLADFQGEFDSFLQDYTCFDDVRVRGRGLRNSGGVNVFVRNSIMRKFKVKRLFSDFKNCVLLFFKTLRSKTCKI